MKLTYLILFILLSSLALADNINVTDADLPVHSIHEFNLSLLPGYYAYLTLLDENPHILLTYPSQVYFNETIHPVLIDYSIEQFSITNDLSIVQTFNISNNYNTYSYLYNLTFNIKKNITYVQINSTDEFDLIDNHPVIKRSLDLIPANGTQSFKLKGYAGLFVNVSFCDHWLTCPSGITFNSNESELNVGWVIPYNTSIGSYEKKITLFTNETNELVIIFNVTEPTFIYEPVSFDECYAMQNLEQMESCFLEKLTLQQKMMADIFALARAKQNNYTQIKEVEKLVMTGSIDGELKSLYDNCVADLNNIRTEYSICSTERNSLLNDKSAFDSLLLQKESQLKIEKDLVLNETDERIKGWEHDKKVRFWIYFFIITLAIVLYVYSRVWEKYNHNSFWRRK